MFSFDAKRFVFEVGGEPFFVCPSRYMAYIQHIVTKIDGVDGRSLLVGAAARAVYEELQRASSQMDESSKKIFAEELYKACGFGSVAFQALQKGGGEIRSKSSFYSRFVQSLPENKRRNENFDAFSVGFLAAAYANIFDMELGETVAAQTKLKSQKDDENSYFVGLGRANFKLQKRPLPYKIKQNDKTDIRNPWEFAQETSETFFGALSALGGDEDGAISAFGGDLAKCPFGYLYNVYHMLCSALESSIGDYGVDFVKDAALECGLSCGFFLFASLIGSEEWETVVKERARNPKERICAALSIAKALGWGEIALVEASSDKCVFKSQNCAEELYIAARLKAKQEETPAPIMPWNSAGALAALCFIAYETDADICGGGDLEDGFLFLKRAKNGFKAEISKSLLSGDDHLEITVTKCT